MSSGWNVFLKLIEYNAEQNTSFENTLAAMDGGEAMLPGAAILLSDRIQIHLWYYL